MKVYSDDDDDLSLNRSIKIASNLLTLAYQYDSRAILNLLDELATVTDFEGFADEFLELVDACLVFAVMGLPSIDRLVVSKVVEKLLRDNKIIVDSLVG